MRKRDEAFKLLANLNEISETKHVSPYAMAELHTSLGETDQAIAWLDKAFNAREAPLVCINVEPWLDPLRPNPRFQGLVRQLGL